MSELSRRITLTKRDEELLVALTSCVKVMSVEQIRGTWWHGRKPSTTATRLKSLCDAGWAKPLLMAVKLVDSTQIHPLAVHDLHDAEPSWHEIVAAAKARWRVPLTSVRGLSATESAARYFGGHCRYPRPSEGSHDLLLTSVYLRWQTHATEAQHWISEARLASEHAGETQIIPDALVFRSGRTVAIEVVGDSYSAAKLQAFHLHCTRKGWSYELW